MRAKPEGGAGPSQETHPGTRDSPSKGPGPQERPSWGLEQDGPPGTS